jgi:hypothetical protein
MKMICSSHHKRGEEVMEFNLSPHYYKEFLKKELLYNHKPIPVISEGWVRIGDYYYLEMYTADGVNLITTITYKLRR